MAKSESNILYNNVNFRIISFMFAALNERKTAHKLLIANCDQHETANRMQQPTKKQPIKCRIKSF